MILDRMKNQNKQVLTKEELKGWVKKNKPVLLITAGAGDIDRELEPLKQILQNN